MMMPDGPARDSADSDTVLSAVLATRSSLSGQRNPRPGNSHGMVGQRIEPSHGCRRLLQSLSSLSGHWVPGQADSDTDTAVQ
jgi:hypothetical protein